MASLKGKVAIVTGAGRGIGRAIAVKLAQCGADGYDEARFARVFNVRRPECYPAAVLVAESEDDVVAGVRLARDRGWKVAIRAGGHSFPAWSVRDNALLICR